MSAPMPITIHTPRQPDRPSRNAAEEGEPTSIPIGHTQAPPMKCTVARMRPRMRLGRIFAGISESERLLAAEAEPGDEAAATSNITVGASAPRIVNTPNTSRLNW